LTTSTTGSHPTIHNPVQFGVDTVSQQTAANVTVTGDGGSASLGLYGNLTLAGTFRTGALNLLLFYKDAPVYDYLPDSLTITGVGNSLKARSARAYGTLTVNDGATMTVAGTYDIKSGRPGGNSPHYQFDGIGVDGAGSRLTVGVLTTDNASILAITHGGYLQARHIVLDNTYGVASYTVDEQSTIEIGTLGNAAAGTWTIDATRSLTIEKDVTLEAPQYVVNGVIDDVGGLYLKGSPSNVTNIAGDATGTGRIRIEANASLKIGGGGDQLSIVFGGANAELDLANGTTGFNSAIRRFAAGDSIQVSNLTFNSATWQRNVLSLFDGGTLVGTLKMFGRYAGDTFSVSNGTITLDAPSSGATAERSRSRQLFTQAMASFERQTSALHDFSVPMGQQAGHPMLAAAH
jgi:hypothetical protein